MVIKKANNYRRSFSTCLIVNKTGIQITNGLKTRQSKEMECILQNRLKRFNFIGGAYLLT
jgi:hypothetical protein